MKETVFKYERNLEFLSTRSAANEDPPTSNGDALEFFLSLSPPPVQTLADDKGNEAIDSLKFTFHQPLDSDESDGAPGGWRHASPVTLLLRKMKKHIHRRPPSEHESGTTASFRACVSPLTAAADYSPYALDAESLMSSWINLFGDAVPSGHIEKDPFGNSVPRNFERVRKATLSKEEFNRRFHEIHPSIDQSFSLSKLRSLKFRLFRIVARNPKVVDPVIALCAWVYFERLVLEGFVKKKNRRSLLGTCIIISQKFRSYMKDEAGRFTLLKLIDVLAPELLDRSAAFKLEYPALCHLSFDLKVEMADVGPHLVHYVSIHPKLSFQKVCGYSLDALCKIARVGCSTIDDGEQSPVE